MEVENHPKYGWVTGPTEPNAHGAAFRARLVCQGEAYGRDLCLTHDQPDPLIEWYDVRGDEKFGWPGQFVSRYYLTTMAQWTVKRQGPLVLDGGVAYWTVCEQQAAEAVDMLVRAWRTGRKAA